MTLAMPIEIPPAIEIALGTTQSFAFRDESVLGTRMNLLFVAESTAVAREAATAVRAAIDRLNLILNSRDPSSELSRLNDSREHRASPELFAVVSAAERWRTLGSGAYSGRLGQVLDCWSQAERVPPSASRLQEMACAADEAHVELDALSSTIVRPQAVRFALDGLAKGWIVDQAFAVAMAMPGIVGALIDIGGDVRCGGQPPGAHGWCIGVPDPKLPADNAPLVATAHLSNHAIATSGIGPRDRLFAGVAYSSTISPWTGWPIDRGRSASVIASTAADADALATAALVMPEHDALDLLTTQ